MKVEIAKEAGYCYGVERSLNLAKKALAKESGPIKTFGPIIHNDKVVEWLKEKGIGPIESLNEIEEGVLIIRSHGVAPSVIEEAKAKGLKIIDATCPFVKKAQKCGRDLVKNGYELVIIGEKDHPEVVGILAHAAAYAHVIDDPDQLVGLNLKRKVGVVVQTTQPIAKVKSITAKLLEAAKELKVYNTICDATTNRQAAAAELALRVDLMLVVGSKASANTTRLAEISKAINPKSYHIESLDDIDLFWFCGADSVGITAGASAPVWIIDEVRDLIEKIGQQ